jgi:hypothetical protein
MADASPIESLDRCIQYRLHDFQGFGVSRLIDVPQHLYRFTPETPDEASAVEELRKAGRDVVLYLGGRGLLDPARDAQDEPIGARTFSPAINVTEPAPSNLPLTRALRVLGRKSLAASAAGEPVSGSVGRWRIDVRPVRADRQDCVDCHSPKEAGPGLRIGDALGVVVYASADSDR